MIQYLFICHVSKIYKFFVLDPLIAINVLSDNYFSILLPFIIFISFKINSYISHINSLYKHCIKYYISIFKNRKRLNSISFNYFLTNHSWWCLLISTRVLIRPLFLGKVQKMYTSQIHLDTWVHETYGILTIIHTIIDWNIFQTLWRWWNKDLILVAKTIFVKAKIAMLCILCNIYLMKHYKYILTKQQ